MNLSVKLDPSEQRGANNRNTHDDTEIRLDTCGPLPYRNVAYVQLSVPVHG